MIPIPCKDARSIAEEKHRPEPHYDLSGPKGSSADNGARPVPCREGCAVRCGGQPGNPCNASVPEAHATSPQQSASPRAVCPAASDLARQPAQRLASAPDEENISPLLVARADRRVCRRSRRAKQIFTAAGIIVENDRRRHYSTVHLSDRPARVFRITQDSVNIL